MRDGVPHPATNFGAKKRLEAIGRTDEPHRAGDVDSARSPLNPITRQAKALEIERQIPGLLDDPMAAFYEELANAVEGLKGDDRAAYDDLEFYSRYVLGYENEAFRDNSRMIKRIYRELQEGADDSYLILGPRQSAKSSAVTITYMTWMIGRNPMIRFLLAVASVEKQGEAFARQIDQILTRNERYIRVFGELKPEKPDKWTNTEKIVRRPEPPGGLKDATLAVVGLGTAAPSKRADILICDDLVTQDNAYSEVLRAKVIAFVFQTLWPIVVPGGKKIIIGSRWHPSDLYSAAASRWDLELPKLPQINFDRLKGYAKGSRTTTTDDADELESSTRGRSKQPDSVRGATSLNHASSTVGPLG